MKAEVTREKESFKPITLTITMETENDAMWFSELFNITRSELVKVNDRFKALRDPDINAELCGMIEKALEQ